MLAITSAGFLSTTGQSIPFHPTGRYAPPVEHQINDNRLAFRMALAAQHSYPNREFWESARRVAQQFVGQIPDAEQLEKKFGIIDLVESFAQSISYLLQMGYGEKIRVDITPENTLLVRATKDGLNTYLETFFYPDTDRKPKVVLNLWKGRQQLITDSGSMEDMLRLHQNQTGREVRQTSQFGMTYGIPGSYLTPTTV